MSTVLNFKPDYYKVTRLLAPNVLEVEGTWFIKLKGVSDNTPPEELKKWLKEENIVRIIPYRRNNEARIISDVWLGSIHINRQFPNYKIDNFIQDFERWNISRKKHGIGTIETEKELVKSFYMAESLIDRKLKHSFKKWIESRYPQKRTGPVPVGIEEIASRKEEARDKMIEAFNFWKEKQT